MKVYKFMLWLISEAVSLEITNKKQSATARLIQRIAHKFYQCCSPPDKARVDNILKNLDETVGYINKKNMDKEMKQAMKLVRALIY